MRALIGVIRLTTFFLASLFTLAFQSTLMLFTRGPVALVWPRMFHALCTKIMGIKVIVEGEIAQGPNVVFIGNHISYLDIPVIGGVIKGSFVAKKEVESWPFFGIMGKMGRTIYMSRAPIDAPEATRQMQERLDEPSPLILFPEGTSSSGKQILPFKSSGFEIFLNRNLALQPFTLSLIEINGEKVTTDAQRDLYAWYGDMTLPPHLWAIAKGKGAVLKLIFQKPILSSSYNDRKLLCADVYAGVVKGLDLSASEPYGHSFQTKTPQRI